MPEHLFVYGTLLPDLAPPGMSARLAELVPLGAARVAGRLYDLGPYPGAVDVGDAPPSAEAAGPTIRGEVFRLPAEGGLLDRLDAYENHVAHDPRGGLFARRATVAQLDDGRAVDCWIYVYNRSLARATPIPDGDYRRWRRGATASA